MSEEKKAVETTTETAAAQSQGVETKVSTAPETPDYSALLAIKDAELAKVREEKDNYRKGLLAAKGKLPEETDPYAYTETKVLDEDLMRKIAREEYLNTKESQLQSERETALQAVVKQNEELRLALKNRSQVASTTGGSNQERPEVKTDSFFSNEQIASLKAKGFTDQMIENAKEAMKKKL